MRFQVIQPLNSAAVRGGRVWDAVPTAAPVTLLLTLLTRK